jgi:multidrug efflux pump subunit AcrA (membrane-fusion protein)
MRILKKSNLVILAFVSMAAGIGFQIYRSGQSTLGESRYGRVRRGDLIQRVTVSGQIQPLKRTIFIPPYTGYIHKIFVTIGQKVRKGDPVIAIAPTLSGAEQIFPIRAPFDGIIVDIGKTEGEFVVEKKETDRMVRLDNNDKFFVIAKSAELDAARIRKGMEVEIRVNAIGKSILKGIVRNLDLAAEEADGWKAQQSTFDVRVEVLNPPDELRSGQSAILDIVTDRYKDVLYLEHEFINKEGDRNFVITRKGKRKDIQVGRQSDVAVEILSGLHEGEEVEQVDFLKLLESGA